MVFGGLMDSFSKFFGSLLMDRVSRVVWDKADLVSIITDAAFGLFEVCKFS